MHAEKFVLMTLYKKLGDNIVAFCGKIKKSSSLVLLYSIYVLYASILYLCKRKDGYSLFPCAIN